MRKIFLIIVILVVFGLFFGNIIYSILTKKDITLKFNQAIELDVKNIESSRGFLIMEDSIALSGNTPLISPISEMESFKNSNISDIPNKLTIDKVLPPFKIKKGANNDTIHVYHYQDTLKFQLIIE